ncbi:MAG: MCP four helix bundle domain-containing protein, partial [Firmicutes bacterium]|nr:MCP four helix bundle domain-containing protein [Bacillota bacterium]
MRAFYNLSTSVKLGIGFGTCVLLTVAVGVFSLVQLAKVNQPAREVVEHHLANAIAFGEIDSNMQQLRAREFRHMLAIGNMQEMQATEAAARKNIEAVDETFKQYEASLRGAEDRQTFEELKSAWAEYVVLHHQLIQLNRQGKRDEAERFVAEKMRPVLRERLDPLIHKIDEEIAQKSKRAETVIEETYQRARLWTGIFVVCAVLVSSLFGWLISRYLTGVVRQMMRGMENLRTGDLASLQQAMQAMEQGNLTAEVVTQTPPLNLSTRDEFGTLARTYNAMLDGIHEIGHAFAKAQESMRNALIQAAQAAGEVSGASGELAGSTEQSGQASTEIARGSEQLAQQATAAAQAMDNLDRAIRTVQQGSEAQREAAQQAEEGMRQA